MNKIDEAKLAWKAWNLLDHLGHLLWERYEQQFTCFLFQDQQEPLFPPLPDKPEDPSP